MTSPPFYSLLRLPPPKRDVPEWMSVFPSRKPFSTLAPLVVLFPSPLTGVFVTFLRPAPICHFCPFPRASQSFLWPAQCFPLVQVPRSFFTPLAVPLTARRRPKTPLVLNVIYFPFFEIVGAPPGASFPLFNFPLPLGLPPLLLHSFLYRPPQQASSRVPFFSGLSKLDRFCWRVCFS